MNISVVDTKNCYSCRSCEQICPSKSISMVENNEGFIYPAVDEKKCTDCGLCLKRCPSYDIYKNNIENQKYIAIKLKDKQKIMQSASGGAFAGLAEYILKQNGIVYGAGYTDTLDVCNKRVDSLDDLNILKGSKYVASNTMHTYSEVKKDLLDGKKVLYSGCPCQIAGLKKYLNKEYDNLYTLDLICHGVPSLKLFKKYLEYLSLKMKDKVIYYGFRDKVAGGWSCEGIAKTKQKVKIIKSNIDPYYSSFLKADTYRYSCYQCKYADINIRPGDISIGDFWGVPCLYPDFNSDKGVSVIVINNSKGNDLFNAVESNYEVKEITLDDAAYRNGNLVAHTKMPEKRAHIYDNIDEFDCTKFMKRFLPSKKTVLKRFIYNLIPRQFKNYIKSKLHRA